MFRAGSLPTGAMYDRLLFPTDGSDPAAEALEYAVAVAREHGGTLDVLSVVTDEDGGTDEDGITREAGERAVEAAAARARERGVSVVTAVSPGDPSEVIVDHARAAGAELIVVPTHGQRGLRRRLLGSVTERVINTAPVPVLAINPGSEPAPGYPPGDVLVPTDGSRGATLAVRDGVELAAATGATLHLLHVIETGRLGPDADSSAETDRADAIVAEAAETATAAGLEPRTSVVEHGEPARAIREYVEDAGVDLAVVGTQGRTEFSRNVLGGVAAKLVRTAPVPVVWVRAPASEADGDDPPSDA